MKVSSCLLPVLLCLLSTPPAQAQFWEKKDWRTWSKAECEKLLSDSPWARRFTTANVVNYPTGQESGGTGRESRQEIEYIAQLRSALPVRQAVVRLAQIQNNYDKMSEAQKKSFDQQAEQYTNQSFGNRVVAHVYYSSNVQMYDRELARLWQSVIPPAVPLNVYLIGPRGEYTDVARFIRGEGAAREFELIFPKDQKGQPLVREDDKSFSLQLPGIAFYERRILIEFDVRKMKYKGTLEY